MLEKTSTELISSQKQEIIKNQIDNKCKRKYSAEEKSSIYYTKEKLKKSKIEMPIEEYKSQVFQIEKELFENLNLEWGIDIISEDMPLIDNKNNNYYCHIIRTAKPDPNKSNFFFNTWIYLIRFAFYFFNTLFNKTI